MSAEERRRRLGEKAVARAREIAAQAPRLDPNGELYAALSVLLSRRKPRDKDPEKDSAA